MKSTKPDAGSLMARAEGLWPNGGICPTARLTRSRSIRQRSRSSIARPRGAWACFRSSSAPTGRSSRWPNRARSASPRSATSPATTPPSSSSPGDARRAPQQQGLQRPDGPPSAGALSPHRPALAHLAAPPSAAPARATADERRTLARGGPGQSRTPVARSEHDPGRIRDRRGTRRRRRRRLGSTSHSTERSTAC